MFAVRFDPNNVAQVIDQSEGSSVVPLKRGRTQEDDGEEMDDNNKAELEEEELEIQPTSSEEELDKEVGIEEVEDDDVEMQGTEEIPKKHSSIMSRFTQTISLQDKIAKEEIIDGEQNVSQVEVPEHALEHIPQPAIVRDEYAQQISKEHKSVAWFNTAKVHYDNSMVKPFTCFADEMQPKLLQNVEKYFSANSFPIQTALLENLLPILNFSLSTTKKHLTRRVGDVLVNASTGSGKTLAYSIPIVQLLSKRTVNRLRALIIVPTKLLINQVYDTINKLAQGTGLIISISKLENSLKEEHKKFMQSEPDVLIITPGRLVDHLQMKSISMKNLQMLILDEADHLLNQSFQNWCPRLLSQIIAEKHDQRPGNVIKMVFSATLTTNTEKLHGLNLNNPRLFIMDSVKLYSLPEKLQEYVVNIPTSKSLYKPLILLHLLDHLKSAKVLVFVKSNEASLRLACLLNILIDQNLAQRHIVETINSNNSKGENKRLVNKFASAECESKNRILITTDLMSRGIDINDISDVINYDLPISSQQYVHRCGRTARAQSKGNAYNLLVGKGERDFWKDQIDEDMSREVNGLPPQNWGEEIISSDANSEPSDALINISTEEEDRYKHSLELLKEKATKKNA